MQVEAMLQACEYQLVLQEAKRFFAQPDANAKDGAVWWCVGASWSATQLHRWAAAIAWADRGVPCARGDQEAIGWLKFYAGSASAHIGDLMRAERELQQFRLLAADCPKLRRIDGDALYNLGYVARARSLLADEIEYFTKAQEAYRMVGLAGKSLASAYEIGWSYLLAGRPLDAEPVLTAVAAAFHPHEDPILHVDLSIAMALFHSQCGRLALSDQLGEALLQTEELSDQRLADIKWILARNALERGDHAEATRHVTTAYEAALEHWWPPQLERIDRLRRQVTSQPVGR
jgi:tetratricopeptide (TPR) repeat protein